MNDERRKKEILLEKLRETVAIYGDGLSVAAASAMLSRLADELYRVSICQMDASRAMKDYTVDARGNVYENEKSDHLKRRGRNSRRR